MKFGINLLLFGDAPTPAVLQRFKLLREMGFDGVEVPIFQPDKLDTDRVRRAADRAGLALSTSGALPPGTRFYGSDRKARAAAAKYMQGTIRAAAALGSEVLCGPLYKAVGDCDQSLALDKQRRETAQALREEILPLAEELGVTLAFEPLNRFETNLINTVEQGIAFCSGTKSPRAGLLLDTFHMHIEEKDSAVAIRAAARAGVLSHFHAAENDRGIAGSGQVHWEAVFRSLRAAKYDGWILLESFNQDNQAIKTAVSCWRPFFPSERDFLKQGLAFVKRMLR